MVKTAAFYLVPIESYSKNTHPPFILKWAVVQIVVSARDVQKDKRIQYIFFRFKKTSTNDRTQKKRVSKSLLISQ